MIYFFSSAIKADTSSLWKSLELKSSENIISSHVLVSVAHIAWCGGDVVGMLIKS